MKMKFLTKLGFFYEWEIRTMGKPFHPWYTDYSDEIIGPYRDERLARRDFDSFKNASLYKRLMWGQKQFHYVDEHGVREE